MAELLCSSCIFSNQPLIILMLEKLVHKRWVSPINCFVNFKAQDPQSFYVYYNLARLEDKNLQGGF